MSHSNLSESVSNQLVEFLGEMRRNWIAGAELHQEFRGSSPRAVREAVSFFFTDRHEWKSFAERLPEEMRRRDERWRDRLLWEPRRWVKLEVGRPTTEASQYFVVDPAVHFPLTTLRVALKSLGWQNSEGLEAVVNQASFGGESELRFAVVVKGNGQPRLSMKIPRARLGSVHRAAEITGMVNPAPDLLAWDEQNGYGDWVFWNADLRTGQVGLDYEGPFAGDPRTSDPRVRNVKVRVHGGEVQLGTYAPLVDFLPDPIPRIGSSSHYYQEFGNDILRHYPTAYQAGQLRDWLDRLPLTGYERILDAGGGHGGPAEQILERWPRVTLTLLTAVASQAAQASSRLARFGDRARVVVGDYEATPFTDEFYDAILFLESACYAQDFQRLSREATRLLRANGVLYVRDVFLRTPVSRAAAYERSEFEAVYRCQLRPSETLVQALRDAGCVGIKSESIDRLVDMRGWYAPMFGADGELNDFGRTHYRFFQQLPSTFQEVTARRSNATLATHNHPAA